jgi:ADP-ribose pyrophosphatase YjhB (NUDIX family)
MANSSECDSGRELIARAVVIQDGAVLVNRSRNNKTGLEYSALPGGHVDPGESCVAALQREFEEELRATIEVGDLEFVVESIYAGRGAGDSNRHELVLYYAANLHHTLQEVDGRIPSPEAKKNFGWLKLSEITRSNLVPEAARQHLMHPQAGGLGGDFRPRYTFHDSTVS